MNSINRIFPEDLSGLSVLIFSDELERNSFYSDEAKRRNAEKVIELKYLYELNTDQNHKYDYVLYINFNDSFEPIHTIKKLSQITRKILIVETKKTAFDFIPDILKPASYCIDKSGKHSISRNWIKNYFSNVCLDFIEVEYINSDKIKIVKAIKREIDSIIILAGPSAVGKTHLLDSNKVDSDNLMELDNPNNWDIIGGQDIETNNYGVINNLILHYDITRPIKRGYLEYESEPCLSILRASDNTGCYLLFTKPKTLIERINRRLFIESNNKPSRIQKERVDFMNKVYSNSSKIRAIYEYWLRYCEKNNIEITYIDVSGNNSAKKVTKTEAFEIIK